MRKVLIALETDECISPIRSDKFAATHQTESAS